MVMSTFMRYAHFGFPLIAPCAPVILGFGFLFTLLSGASEL